MSVERESIHDTGAKAMFTGIVQSLGLVRSIRTGSTAARLALHAPGLTRPIPLGSSIAVNGVCLTVAACDESHVEFDVIPETLSRSTLGSLTAGARVNLERALRAGDPLDGHMVQGHVDGIARVYTIRTSEGDGHVVSFRVNSELMPFIIPKGSIAIDGVSLTIAGVESDTFGVALIPTTLAVTTLGALKAGDRVNIETDILARTIVTTLRRYMGTAPNPSLALGAGSAPSSSFQTLQPAIRNPQSAISSGLTVEALRENGW